MSEPAETTPTSPQEAMASLREFLATLEPEDVIVLTDSQGKTHEVRTTLPARRHIRALRLLDEVAKKVPTVDGIDLGSRGGIRRVLAGIRSAIHEDEVVNGIGKVFAEAYPEAVAAAGGGDPLDLFPLEAVLEGIVPLLSRLLAKALAMGEKMTPKTGTPSGT